MISKIGLRAQIMIGLLALVVLGFAVVATTSVVALRSQLLSRVDAQLSIVRVMIPSKSGLLAGTGEISSPQVTVPGVPVPVSHLVELLRPDGRVVEVAHPPGQDPVSSPLVTRITDLAGHARTGAPFSVRDGGGAGHRAVATPLTGQGTLLVAAPLEPIRQTVAWLLTVELLTCLAVLLAVALLGHLALVRGLRPLASVTATADAIAAGDLSRRLPELGYENEVGRLSRAVNATLAQLVSALEGRGRSEDRLRRFVADASHELRTPLTSIRGYVQLLRSGVITDAGAPDALRRVAREAERMSELIEELLVLARGDEQRPLGGDVVDLAGMVRDHVADAVVLEPDQPIQVHAPDRCEITADAPGMGRVVANLLANVRAHTPPGTPATVTLSDRDDHVSLTVTDDGPGMEPEDAARAFDRFYRADRSRSRVAGHGGSGLGLSIVHDVVTAHGGTVRLDSTPGIGTTVAIVLPVSSGTTGSAPGFTRG